MQTEWIAKLYIKTSAFIRPGWRRVNNIPVNQSNHRNRWIKHAPVQPESDVSVSVRKGHFYKAQTFSDVLVQA